MGIFQELISGSRTSATPRDYSAIWEFPLDDDLEFDVSDVISLTQIMIKARPGWAFFAQFKGAIIELNQGEFRQALYASYWPNFPESQGKPMKVRFAGAWTEVYIPNPEIRRKYWKAPFRPSEGTPVQKVWRQLEEENV